MSYAEIKFSQPQRGGRRPGSGRKKLNHVALMLHISVEADNALRRTAQRCDSTPSRVVESLILGIDLPSERPPNERNGTQDAF